MSNTLVYWHAEHVNFEKLLKLLDAQLDLFHRGETPNYDLMLDIMFYMTHYPDVLHHPREDLAFAKIKARHQAIGGTVDALTEQHAQMHELGEALVRSLGDIVNGSIASRESVETQARAYVAAFRRHMAIEEDEVMPLAGHLLRDADWAEISQAVEHVEDPLFGAQAATRYAALHQQIARGAQASG